MEASTDYGRDEDMASGRQLTLSNGYKEAQGRVDQMIIQLGHLAQHAGDGHQEAVEYWYRLLHRSLVNLSVDLEEADRQWRIDV